MLKILNIQIFQHQDPEKKSKEMLLYALMFKRRKIQG